MSASRVLTSRADIPAGDYVSEGLSIVMPDSYFPNMIIGDKAKHPWPYLRREIKHNWYCDQRAPEVGFLNRDEASILYNLALQFSGKPALEIGSWMGWSTCHLALAGLALDVIDPMFANADHVAGVRNSLAAAGVLENVRLYATTSPDGVRELVKLTGVTWGFFFIDGNHEAPAPVRDARECVEHAAQDAMIVFHDLTVPDVEEGLQFLWRQGWQVLVYQTMQIMGVAWRGNVRPVAHTPDPSIIWPLPLHLAQYPVSGASPDEEARRLSKGIAWRDQEIERLQRELTTTNAEVEHIHAELAARDTQLGCLQTDLATREEELTRLGEQAKAQEEELTRLRRDAAERNHLHDVLTTREAELAQAHATVNAQDGELRRLSLEVTRRSQQEEELTRLGEQAKAQEEELTRLRRDAAERNHLHDVLTTREAELAQTHATVNAQDGELRRLSLEVTRRSQDVERLFAEGQRIQQALDGTYRSASWKITRPLRVSKRGVKFLRRLPRRLARAISREAAAYPPDTPRALRIMKATRVVVPQMARRALHACRYLSADWRRHRGTAALIASSGLFDPAFYVAQQPAIQGSVLDPILHYVVRGAMEGLDPHPLFDSSFYLETYPDIAQAGLNPLAHYVEHGGVEGRKPHPLFDSSFYLAMNPDIAQAGLNPLSHYWYYGAGEGRDPHPLFDSSFYLETYPDIAQAGLNPLSHYWYYGAGEGRDPHPLFDTSFYLEQKPHVRALGVNPLVHFLAEGPNADFDPLSATPPLPETGICIVTPDIVGPVKNGGIGTACYHFARVLAATGHPVSVFFTGDVTDCQKAHWRNTFAKMGIRFVALSDTPPVTRNVYGTTWFFERSWRVFEYLRKAQFAVVHFQDWQANGFWSIKAKQVGLAFEQTELTVMMHSCTQWINEGMQQFSATPFETAKLVWAETYCMEHCDRLLSPSSHMLQWAGEHQIHLPSQTQITPYAWADGAPMAPRVDGTVDSDHLIFFGRLETRKGLHIFGEALRQLQREQVALPKALSFLGKHATVHGQLSDAYLEELRRDLPMVEMHIINDFDYVHALSYIRQTRGVVVIPSILDNYPLTVIECIQSGIPFIASTTGGIPEMIDPKVSFEPNPASLAACLKTRHTIDYGSLEHKYSASLAAQIWCDLHADLRTAQLPPTTHAIAQGTACVQRVSVCIPFFNYQRYLDTLVTAFARQNYPAFEVILVNDGSSPEASREFDRVATRCRDRRFRFLTTENRGPGAARNYASEHATGELLLFFDADNVPKGPNFIGMLVRALECSHVDCVTCPYDIVPADRILPTESDVVASYRPMGGCLEAGFFENTFGDATMIITRAAFQKLGGFPTRRASWEDHEFMLQLAFKACKLETFPDTLFYYRQSPTGRHQRANGFRNYQSLFEQLQLAPSADLARIIAAVSGPMLIEQSGCPMTSLIAR